MRKALALLALLAACGGSTVDGTWNYSIAGTGGCSGTMTLNQSGSSVTGAYGCGSLGGNIVGEVRNATAVTLQFQASGFAPALMTGSISGDGTRISGSINGSGYNSQAFSATRN